VGAAPGFRRSRDRRPRCGRAADPIALEGKDFTTQGEFVVEAGERAPFALAYRRSHQSGIPMRDTAQSLAETEGWWRGWSGRCIYEDHPKPGWREAAIRSLITLKCLSYRPTGGIIAAPTTSLPEQLGGVRNWDYRFCWIRDATLTLYALLTSGYHDEARAWRDWLLRATAGRPEELQILYGIAGARRATELELPWLPGYENSRPVRVGTGAFEQLQLDVYGELMGRLARRAAVSISSGTTRLGSSRRSCSTISSGSGPNRATAFGRCAARRAISRTPRSWPGSPWTAR
jgi:GH15 family glucan-1,4-alpha-glucosidase